MEKRGTILFLPRLKSSLVTELALLIVVHRTEPRVSNADISVEELGTGKTEEKV